MGQQYVLTIKGYNEIKNKEYEFRNIHTKKDLALREALTFTRPNITVFEYKINREITLF